MENRGRYLLLDSLRGVALISMILYHTIWDMVYLFGVHITWFETPIEFVWQQSICWSFILISGFTWSLGKRHIKSGIQVLGASFLVTVVTIVFMPRSLVWFGVLSLLGTAMLVMIPLDKVLRKVNPYVGVIVSFGVFLVMRNINQGVFGVGNLVLGKVPQSWYANYITAYLGFPPENFFSTDYFSILPWFFLYLTGYFLFPIFHDRNARKVWSGKGLGFLNWFGQHSLLIYLLHQPVVYGILYLIFYVF